MVMATTINQNSVQWTSPAPMWPELAGRQGPARPEMFRQPSILRFATDSFMDEFAATLGNEPWRLGEWRAAPEAWWCPLSGGQPVTPAVQALPDRARSLTRLQSFKLLQTGLMGLSQQAPEDLLGEVPHQLKLYQPAHQRFYLVTSCLVCRTPGLPDRVINHGAAERAAFVMRRLRPHTPIGADDDYPEPTADTLDAFDEYAYVTTPEGLRWQLVADPETVSVGEETLPMFGVTYTENDGRKRRLLSGLVPVSKREAYMAATTDRSLREGFQPAPMDARMGQWEAQVGGPWQQLIAIRDLEMNKFAQAKARGTDIPNSDGGLITTQDTTSRGLLSNQLTMSSWYTLLDMADYLRKYVPRVWAAIGGETIDPPLDAAKETPLYDALTNTLFYNRDWTYTDLNDGSSAGGVDLTLPEDPHPSVAEALVAIVDPDVRWQLEMTTELYPATSAGTIWPGFNFRLTTSAMETLLNRLSGTDLLPGLVQDALPTTNKPARIPPLPLVAQLHTQDGDEPGWFLIRCVFEQPNCGPLSPPVVSQPTDPFQLAPFFDPEAPARPVRISLPIDTTPAGLRKFAKNTAFAMSDIMCGQISKMRKMTFLDLVLSVLPWPFHKDLNLTDAGPCEDGGMICSFSIPILTLVALILMFIIVSILDSIFHWLPFLVMCFPLPKSKGKKLGVLGFGS